MGNKEEAGLETRTHVRGIEDVGDIKNEALRDDNATEHEMTVKDVFKNHPWVVWWPFYWAMAGVGW